MTNGDCYLGVMENTCNLCFRRRRDNMPEGAAFNENGPREVRVGRGGSAEGEMTRDATASFGGNEVGGIRVDFQDHIIGVKMEGGCGVCGCIIEEAVAQF